MQMDVKSFRKLFQLQPIQHTGYIGSKGSRAFYANS